MARTSSNPATAFHSLIRAILIGVVASGVGLMAPLHSASAQSSAALASLASAPYQRSLIREARLIWGLQNIAAVQAAQIQQESAWLPTAHSTYAAGLSQFTPQTAAWISGAYPKELGTNQPSNPEWAIRALVRYDLILYQQIVGTTNECEHVAMALSAYNGGPGWVERDRALCTPADGCDSAKWFGNSERFSHRSPSAFKENRGYPRRILLIIQPAYISWGGTVSCSEHS